MSSLALPSASYTHITSEADFYAEVEGILSAPLRVPTAFQDDQDGETRNHAAVFEKLEMFVHLLQGCYDRFLEHQYNVDYCVQKLIETELFTEHRREMATCLVDLSHRSTTLQALLVSYDLLLAFGQQDHTIYLSLHGDTTSARDKITRLVHQIWAGHYAAMADTRLRGHAASSAHEEPGWGGAHFDQDDQAETAHGHPMARRVWDNKPHTTGESSNAARTRTHQLRLREKAIRLLYEASRVQRLEPVDMRAIDEKFISHLFDLVELTRSHEDEAFNYLLIKLIVALNEQFMVTAISAAASSSSQSKTSGKNIVIAVLKSRLHVTKTFGENLIFMLNRASSNSVEDHCMQLLVLKLLYLLFTLPETAHYFYTNDLKVLVDVFIRELSDLPEDNESLRHTYLRVFHPLLTNTQLSTTPYKRPQIRRLLRSITKDSLYRGEVSATTRRLVQRCLDAEWCQELDRLDPDFKPVAVPAKTLSNGDSSPALPASASTNRLQPSTVLDAPRFRTVSARSAPNTPPPQSVASSTDEPHQPLSTPTGTVEEEAAMALADAMTTTERAHDPSWQSQIAAHAEEEAEKDTPEDETQSQGRVHTPNGASRSEFLSPQQHTQHRPIPRRASHNEFRKARRPPPAPPVVPQQQDEHSNGRTAGKSTFELLRDEGQDDTADTVVPSVQVSSSSTDEVTAARIIFSRHVDVDADADANYESQSQSQSPPAPQQRSMTSTPTPPPSSSTASQELFDRMSRSLESLSPCASRDSSHVKQRRRPPAPPGSAGGAKSAGTSVDVEEERMASVSSSYDTSSSTAAAAAAAPSESDLVSARSELSTPTSGGGGKRRRPPPPPVNRATKGGGGG